MAMDGHFDAAHGIRAGAEVRLLAPPPRQSTHAFSADAQQVDPGTEAGPGGNLQLGAMDAVVGARLASGCPIVHTEDGFHPDEIGDTNRRRAHTRRLLSRTISSG